MTNGSTLTKRGTRGKLQKLRRKMNNTSTMTMKILLGLLFCLALFLTQGANDVLVRESDEDGPENDKHTRSRVQMFNFASQAAGAVVLDKSPATAKGYQNLLNDDKDKYGISPCDEKKWVVIGLSEEVLITSLELANYEKYSSMLKDFQLLASTAYPTDEWINLGTYTAMPQLGVQSFNITDLSESHTRYLKVKFLTHYSDEALCTLSQIKVYGMTVIASFQQEVERSDSHMLEMRDMLETFNSEQEGESLQQAIQEILQAEEAVVASQAEAESAISVSADEHAAVQEQSVGISSESLPDSDSSAAETDGSTISSTAEIAKAPTADGTATILLADGGSELESSASSRVTHNEKEVSADDAVAHAGEEEKNAHAQPSDSPLSEPSTGIVHLEETTALVLNGTELISEGDDVVVIEHTEPAVNATEEADASTGYRPFHLAEKVKKFLPFEFNLFSAHEPTAAADVPVADNSSTNSTEGRSTAGSDTVPAVESRDEALLLNIDNITPSSTEGEGATTNNNSDSAAVSAVSEHPAPEQTETTTIPAASTPPDQTGSTDKQGTVGGTPQHSENCSAAATGPDALADSSSNNATALAPVREPQKQQQPSINVTLLAEVVSSLPNILLPPVLSIPALLTDAPALANQSISILAQLPLLVPPKTPILSINMNATAGLTANATIASQNASTLSCFENLSFAEFSRKMRAKLQQKSANSTNSGANSTDSATEAALASAVGVSKDNNVFRALMQKMKALEMNNAIVEMYTIQVRLRDSKSIYIKVKSHGMCCCLHIV